MLQHSTSTAGTWRPVHELFEVDYADGYEEVPRYRSVTSMIPDWHSRAECRDKDKSVFFGSSSPEERPAYTLSSIREARSICDLCPVFAECLTHAIREREVYGLWAGTTMNQRREIFKLIDEGVVTDRQVIDALVNRRA